MKPTYPDQPSSNPRSPEGRHRGAASPQDRKFRRERTRWRKAQEQVAPLIERRRRKGPNEKARRRVRYRGRLGTLMDELHVLLRRYGPVAATCERAVSAKTRHDRRLVLTQMLVSLYRGKYQLQHVTNFRGKHALWILQHWTDEGLAPSTMATYVSHLRTFIGWLTKTDLLSVVNRYCAEHPDRTQRHTATDRDKSERAANIDFEELLRRAEATGNKHFAAQLHLIGAFGLRVREAWLFRPHLSVDALGAAHVDWGTKGGRPRKLPAALTPSQRDALDRACALVPNAHASMIPPGYDLKQWSRKFYSLCKKCGFTKKQLGVTPHSLRHGVLLDLYERLAGVPAPVRGGSDSLVDPDRDRDSRQVVAETAGHNRLQASSAYLGSRRHKRREAQPTTKRMPSRDDIPSNERQDAPPNEHKPRASDTD